MWAYEKKLQYPVKIKNPNPLYAKIIVSQLGGPDGELGAALRYLNQRYTMPYGDIIGILTDVGMETICKTACFQKRKHAMNCAAAHEIMQKANWQKIPSVHK